MKSKLLFFTFFLIALVACTPGFTPTIYQIEPTTGILTPTPTNTNPSKAVTAVSTQTTKETEWKTPCREVTTKSPSEVDARGIVILDSRVSLDEGHYKPGTFLLDLGTGKTIQITIQGENQIDHAVSPDGHLMAYDSVIFNSEGQVTQENLVIADAAGKRLKVIPWEEDWFQIPVWLDDEHLRILLQTPGQNSSEEHASLLVLNPFTNERKILEHNFPDFLDTASTKIPYWGGQWGVIYDPTLTFAVYPQMIENNDEMYTFAIRDLSRQKTTASLETVFTEFIYSNYYPMPKWSPDGSRFVLQGFIPTADVKIELYEVSRAGKIKQLTHLSSVAYVRESTYSWSPDGQHIAMFLGSPIGVVSSKSRVAVLDTTTLNVTEYCVNINFNGEKSSVWSPDGKQLLVTSWYEKGHQSVILLDIEKNAVTQIAEDMEPMGWMVKP
jgi:Tol biopolymer transport system component